MCNLGAKSRSVKKNCKKKSGRGEDDHFESLSLVETVDFVCLSIIFAVLLNHNVRLEG